MKAFVVKSKEPRTSCSIFVVQLAPKAVPACFPFCAISTLSLVACTPTSHPLHPLVTCRLSWGIMLRHSLTCRLEVCFVTQLNSADTGRHVVDSLSLAEQDLFRACLPLHAFLGTKVGVVLSPKYYPGQAGNVTWPDTQHIRYLL